MNRLVAFGCSYTYGSGLPDCYLDSRDPTGPNPSTHAWPALTAGELKLDVVNKGRPGASNLRILDEILNFDFNNEDTVIVLWSYYHRDTIFYPNKTLEIKHWLDDDIVKNYYEVHNDYDLIIKTLLHIHHADMFFQQKNIKALHLIKSYKEETTMKNLLHNKKLKWFDTKHDLMILEYIDFGLDKIHPGLKTHMLMSKIILNKLQETK